MRPGQLRPFRAVPADFRERWPQFGWSEAKAEWGAHARTIARWVDELGRDEMVLARKRWLDAQRLAASRERRKRYVLGRTLRPVGMRVGLRAGDDAD